MEGNGKSACAVFLYDCGLAAMLMASLSAPAAASVDVAADNPFIQYHGRFDFTDPKQPRCDWPGTGIEARFTGTSITVKISGGANDFNIIVDGIWKAKLSVDGKTSQVAAAGLADGPHSLLLSKRNEGFQGISTFAGFQLEDGKSMIAPPRAASKKIQFFGDSFTVGYGDEAKVTSCPDRRPFDNNHLAYGPVTARAVGAEYSVQAVSGIGRRIIMAIRPPRSAKPLGAYIENTLFSADTPKWDAPKWIPDIVVIALGTNDFSTSVKPSEDQYSAAYKDFLKRIRAWYPNAVILCMTYAVDNYQGKYVDTLVNQVARLGDAKIHHVQMPSLNAATDLGCDRHPNVAGQQKYADVLTPIVKQYLGASALVEPPARAGKHAGGRIAPGETWTLPYADGNGETRVDAAGRRAAFFRYREDPRTAR